MITMMTMMIMIITMIMINVIIQQHHSHLSLASCKFLFVSQSCSLAKGLDHNYCGVGDDGGDDDDDPHTHG